MQLTGRKGYMAVNIEAEIGREEGCSFLSLK